VDRQGRGVSLKRQAVQVRHDPQADQVAFAGGAGQQREGGLVVADGIEHGRSRG
jgi:hypothetical protein